jgi:hypothetical protein
MERPTFGSPDGPCEKNSDLRVALRKLIEAHGADTVKRVLNSIEPANPVENRRSSGRPVGPAINDWPSLKRAAAIWRQQGGGPVWPALIAVAKSLHGESESNARRLLSRLLKHGRDWDGQFERAAIHDFRMAAWSRRIDRAVTRARPPYRQALVTALAMYWALNSDPGTDSVFKDMIRRKIRQEVALTLEDIVILTQDSPAAKVRPGSLVYDGSAYYLILGRIADEGKFPQPVRVAEGNERRRGRIAFVRNEVRTWVAERIAERDDARSDRAPDSSSAQIGGAATFVSDGSGLPINLKEVVIRDKDSPAQTFTFRVYSLPVPDIASLLDHSPF